MVSFKPIAEYWLVSETVFTYRAHPNSDFYIFDVEIATIAFPKALPDWLFDAAQYKQHKDAGEPDIVQKILETPPLSPIPN
jgi:hypothetical protein